MTTLEERIAEAIRSVADNSAHGGDYWLNLARAVVAVLPTADVSDEAIRAAMKSVPEDVGSLYLDDYVIDGDWIVVRRAVRALLDAQAAAHAAEVEALRAEVERLTGKVAAVRSLRGFGLSGAIYADDISEALGDGND